MSQSIRRTFRCLFDYHDSHCMPGGERSRSHKRHHFTLTLTIITRSHPHSQPLGPSHSVLGYESQCVRYFGLI